MVRPDPHLPPGFTAWLAPFLAGISRRTRPPASSAPTASAATVGPRTVAACLRVLGLAEHPGFAAFHRVLNRNAWSSLAPARTLLRLVAAAFAPAGPVDVGVARTLARR